MPRYMIPVEVTEASGSQVFAVDSADSPEDAIAAFKRGEGELIGEEINVEGISGDISPNDLWIDLPKPSYIVVRNAFFKELRKIIDLPEKGVTKVVLTAELNDIVHVELTMNGQYTEDQPPIVQRFTLNPITDEE